MGLFCFTALKNCLLLNQELNSEVKPYEASETRSMVNHAMVVWSLSKSLKIKNNFELCLKKVGQNELGMRYAILKLCYKKWHIK